MDIEVALPHVFSSASRNGAGEELPFRALWGVFRGKMTGKVSPEREGLAAFPAGPLRPFNHPLFLSPEGGEKKGKQTHMC